MTSDSRTTPTRAIAVTASILALVFFGMRLAFAGVGGAAGPTWPVTLVVGGAVSAYIDIVNASDGVNASENVEVVRITFTPSCAAQTVGACTTADPGVFTLAPTAFGDPSTSCKNTIFTLIGSTSGAYTLVPNRPVYLGPADGSGGASNPKRCRIVINATVAKLRVDSTPPGLPITTIQLARAVLRGQTTLASGAATGQATIAITATSVVDLVITKNDKTPPAVTRAGVT